MDHVPIFLQTAVSPQCTSVQYIMLVAWQPQTDCDKPSVCLFVVIVFISEPGTVTILSCYKEPFSIFISLLYFTVTGPLSSSSLCYSLLFIAIKIIFI